MALILAVLLLDLAMDSADVSNQIRVYNWVSNAESGLNTVEMVTNYSGGVLGSFLGTYIWGICLWNGVFALGFFPIAATGIVDLSR